ncbi:MAG: GntR family transcriptional regulator [Acidimicrobiales bacterium]
MSAVQPVAEPPSGAADDRAAAVPIQDIIETELRERILLGQIEPGGRINVRQLEQHFGVSHIPIREAMRRLEAEGLVVNVPKRGAVAAGVSLKELDDVYDLRRIIEPRVAERAVGVLADADLAEITGAYEALVAAEHDPSDIDFSTAHWDFHWHVLRPGSTDEIERLLHRLWRVADRYVRLTRGAAIDAAHDQHHQLYDACAGRDAAAAADILERHLHLTGDALRSQLHRQGLE